MPKVKKKISTTGFIHIVQDYTLDKQVKTNKQTNKTGRYLVTTTEGKVQNYLSPKKKNKNKSKNQKHKRRKKWRRIQFDFRWM